RGGGRRGSGRAEGEKTAALPSATTAGGRSRAPLFGVEGVRSPRPRPWPAAARRALRGGAAFSENAQVAGTFVSELRGLIADRQVVAFVGTGVSVGATAGDPAASWVGLLTRGVEHC